MLTTLFALSQLAFSAEIAILDIKSPQKGDQASITHQLMGGFAAQSDNKVYGGLALKHRLTVLNLSSECHSRKCAQKIGEKLGLDYIIYGQESVGVISLTSLDIQQEKVSYHYNIRKDQQAALKLETFVEQASLYASHNNASVHYSNARDNNIGFKGMYRFDVRQDDVNITIDDTLKCVETPCELPLTKGVHKATFSKKGYRSQTWYFHTSHRFHVDLIGQEPQVSLGFVAKDSVVYLDGNIITQDPTLPIQVSEGKHRIETHHKCYQTVKTKFKIQAGDFLPLNIVQAPKRQKILVEDGKANPIYVDGVFYGHTDEVIYVPLCARYMLVGADLRKIEEYTVPNGL